MELAELLEALLEHNKTGNRYQIQLNSGNLDRKSNRHTDVEFGDLYFVDFYTLNNSTLLCFGNMGKKPIEQSEGGETFYPCEINSHMFLDITKVDAIEEVKDFEDWFCFPSVKVVNIYMLPENDNVDGKRNVVTVGFMG